MEKMLVQGDLYVRKTFYAPTKEKEESVEALFNGYLSDYDEGEINIFKLYKKISEDYNNLCIYKGKDYSNSECVYQLVIKNGKYFLVNLSRPEIKEFFEIDLNNLDSNFVSLREFISNAQFIGEEGYVENPQFYDIHLFDAYNPCMVLYHGVEGVLVIRDKEIIFLDERYGEVDWVYQGGKVKSSDEAYLKELRLQLKKNIEEYKDTISYDDEG